MNLQINYLSSSVRAFLRWSIFGIITGLIAGGIASVFDLALVWANTCRRLHPQIIFGLPLAGLAISWLYYHLGEKGDRGTNLVIESIRNKEYIPWYVGIRIFFATFMTHLFGGSAGREGAALQLGGSISSTIARVLHNWKLDRNAVIMTGMAASFSALFGTPLAATVFALEMVNVGEIYYAALVPCSFAAVVGLMTARLLGVEAEHFAMPYVPDLTPYNLIMAVLLAACCTLVGIIFCMILKKSHTFFHAPFFNHYAAVFTAGCLLVLLNLAVHSTDYMGAGMHVIAAATGGHARPEAFLFKIIFTAITLGSCYKGGEIVPSFLSVQHSAVLLANWSAFILPVCSHLLAWYLSSAASPTVRSHPCSSLRNCLVLTASIIFWSVSASATCFPATPVFIPARRSFMTNI